MQAGPLGAAVDEQTRSREQLLDDLKAARLEIEKLKQELSRNEKVAGLMGAQHDLAMALGAGPELEQGMLTCLDTALQVSGMDAGGIYLVDQDQGGLRMVVHRGLSPEFVASASRYPAESPSTQLVMNGEPVYSRHRDLGVSLDENRKKESLQGIGVIPIRHRDQVIGCLNVASHALEQVPEFSRTSLEAIADQTGSAIAHMQTQEALRESEQRFRRLVETIPEGVTTIDMQGKITFVSSAALKLYGYTSPEELLGKSGFEFIAPQDRQRALDSIQLVLSEGRMLGVEFTLLDREGNSFPGEVSTAVIPDSQGQPRELVNIAHDITERKHAEQQQRVLSSAIRQSSQAIAVVRPDGIVEYANPRFLELNKFSPDEVIGRNWNSFLSGSSVLREFHDEIVDALVNKGTSWTGEFKDSTREGSHWRRASIFPIKNDKGELTHSVYMSEDITERKQVEESLRESEEKYRNLVERANDGVVIGREGIVSFANQQAARVLGLTLDEMIGTKFADFIHPDERHDVMEIYQRRMNGEKVPSVREIGILRPDGRRMVVETNSTMINYEGKPAVLAFIRDVTERKNTEKQLRSLAIRLSQVEDQERRRIATDLHDSAAQNLAAALLKLRALKQTMPAESQTVDEIHELVEQTAKQLRTLSMDLSPPALYEIGLAAALESLAERFSNEHGISCSFKDHGPERPIDEDTRALLYRCIGELLANISRHAAATSSGVSFNRFEDRIELLVFDDGRGFEVSSSEKGYGLFSIRERLRAVDGEMHIESQPGSGTRVTLVVPFGKGAV